MNTKTLLFCRTNSKLALVILLFFAGCQTPNIPEDFSFSAKEHEKTAIIIGSVSQSLDYTRESVADFRLDHTIDKKTTLLYSMKVNEVLGSIANKYGFEDSDIGGRVFVVEIEAGKHQLDYWSINYGNNRIIVYPKVLPPKLEFNVKNGQIMYIGNFHLEIDYGKHWSLGTIPEGGVPAIQNEYDRDIQYFHEKYPQLKDKEITINVLHDGTWINEIHEEEELEIPKSKE